MTTNSTVAGDSADLRDSILAVTRNQKRAAYKREWYAKNEQQHKANQKRWHEAHREESAQKAKDKRSISPLVNLRESIKLGLRRKGGNINANFMLQMWLDQDGCCALSGIKMVWGGGTGPRNISIDRIDATRGYYKDNVRLVCHAVNSFRGQMSDDELLMMATTLVANMQAKKVIAKISQEEFV